MYVLVFLWILCGCKSASLCLQSFRTTANKRRLPYRAALYRIAPVLFSSSQSILDRSVENFDIFFFIQVESSSDEDHHHPEVLDEGETFKAESVKWTKKLAAKIRKKTLRDSGSTDSTDSDETDSPTRNKRRKKKKNAKKEGGKNAKGNVKGSSNNANKRASSRRSSRAGGSVHSAKVWCNTICCNCE